jgi:hypothetical protein
MVGMYKLLLAGCVPEKGLWHATVVGQLFANLLEYYVADLVTNDEIHRSTKILKNYC